MVGVDSGSLYTRAHSLSRLAWSWVGGRFGDVLHSSNEPGELSQWLCHDDSTINIVLVLLLFLGAFIIIIFFILFCFVIIIISSSSSNIYHYCWLL